MVFEIELPDFDIAPTSRPELKIPSANVNYLLIHILNPFAERIDYSQISTSVNGQFTATISETFSGSRGKLVKINLTHLPGFQFVPGRNTVEVWARNRGGRIFYSSFVVRTATENRNEGFTYEVVNSAKNSVPPELVLLEPEQSIEVPPLRKSLSVRISGFATAVGSVARVSVDGKNLVLKKGSQEVTRGLGLANDDRSVTFETIITVVPATREVKVEAEDDRGARTRVAIPVVRRTEPARVFTGRKFALIIGISRFRHSQSVPNLKYADEDARSIYQFLQSSSGGKFPADNMRLLLNEQATLTNINAELTSFIGKASANDLLLIFIAGHGAPDPAALQNLYILAHDTNPENMPDTALAMNTLGAYIQQNVRAERVVLLIDTCHSAGLSTEVARAVQNNLVNLYLEKLLYQEKGRAIITSSDVNEYSRESVKWGNGHGVFTYYLLEGLNGKADTNEDRLVSVGELFRFVRQKVRLDTQFQQNPRMLVGENEELALAAMRASNKR